jgi:hypothetical protein
MSQLGWRRDADPAGDPLGLLAYFSPGPDCSARVLLHPRLTFLPCRVESHESLAATFQVGVDARIVRAADIAAWSAYAANRAAPDTRGQLGHVVEAVVGLRDADGDDADRLAERDRLIAESTALRRDLAAPDLVHEVRAALSQYQLQLWAAQRDDATVDGGLGYTRLAETLERLGVNGDGSLDERARRWLADRELHVHYARQHLEAVNARIAALEPREPMPDVVSGNVGSWMRWISTAVAEQVVVLVELVDPSNEELIDALIDASSVKRIVYVTADVPLLREAMRLPSELAAARDVLVNRRPVGPVSEDALRSMSLTR